MPGQPSATLITGGIGGNISGVLVPRWDADDRIKFAVNAGSGIGRYIADLSSLGGQDAVYDPVQVSLRALPVASGYFGYEHAWSRVFTTAVTYGVVNVSNLDIQLEDAFHRTQRTSINLMWNPVPFVDIVVEFLAGRASTRMASAPPRVRFRVAGRSSSDTRQCSREAHTLLEGKRRA